MHKRPLCLAVVLLIMILWMIPKDVWYEIPDIPSGTDLLITGTVTKREQQEDQQVYYLESCFCDSSVSIFSVLAYTPKGHSYPIGCELSLYGTIYQLNEATNPGQFDARDYYQSQGILYTFQGETVRKAEGEDSFRENLTLLRESFGEQILRIYGERDGGILKAVLLGDKSSLRKEDQLLYQKNGISHLLAISGLHISMIGIGLYKFLRKCHLTFAEAGIPSGILLLLYGMMTGFGISTIRAVCMFLVMILGDVLGRAYDMASAMALAALIILLRNPLQAWQAGFLLSFGAVCGICVVYPILQSVFQINNQIFQTLLFSTSISLVTYPVTVHFFYEYPLYSMLFNLFAIPCMPFVMGFGGAGALAGCLFPSVGKIIGIPAHWALSLYEFVGKWVIGWPLAVVRLGREEPWQLIIYYALLILALLLLWYGRRKIYLFLLPAALLTVSVRFEAPLEYAMLDVGQGDGMVLQLPGGTVCLIDGGSTSVKNIGTYRLLPYFKYEGIEKLDYIVLTHLDEDHTSGVRELLEMSAGYDGVEIGMILFPDIMNPDENYKELWSLAENYHVQTGIIGEGNQITGETWKLQCLSPVQGSFCQDKNESSTVLQLDYMDFSMLFTGDIGYDGESRLIEAAALENVDVWKVSHHGSKYSGSDGFLHKISPQLSLISVGKNNYGHPSEEILERLNTIGSQVETTLESGAIIVQSDGETFTLSLQSEDD